MKSGLVLVSLCSAAQTFGQGCPHAWAGWPAEPPSGQVFVDSFAVYGGQIFAGGMFQGARAGVPQGFGIAIWNGEAWVQAGGGLEMAPGLGVLPSDVTSLVPFGGSLYAAGWFTLSGSSPLHHIARWDGSQWLDVGGGVQGLGPAGLTQINDAVVHDDGSGVALYVGGSFTSAGGLAATGIARWTGTQWQAVGTPGGAQTWVIALRSFDDGSGPKLFAGGQFTSIGGVSASRIARWDGSQWEAFGAFDQGEVDCLCVYDAGDGPRLYAGGSFTSGAGVSLPGIARWNGRSWEAVGQGVSSSNGSAFVECMTVFDDGSGSKLYVGGAFDHVGGIASNGPGRYDGHVWEAPGGGVGGGGVYALAPAGAQFPGALAVGGDFTRAGDQPVSGGLALWNWCPCYANCDGSVTPPVLNVSDFACFLQRFAAGDPYANCDLSTASPALNVADFTCFLQKFARGCN